MAQRTPGERIAELERQHAVLAERVTNLQAESNDIYAEVTERARAFDELRREHEREIALLKREIEELKKDRERWGQRLWMILAPFLAAAAGMGLAYLLGLKR